MRKENTLLAGNGEPTGRITRARAAASHLAGGMLPLKPPPAKHGQKRVLCGNSKRAALNENNHIAPVTVACQQKRRAVLKDVTNVFCENSYRKCISAAKMQIKGFKKPKAGTGKKDAKVVPVVAVEHTKVQEDAEQKKSEEMQKMDALKPHDMAFSVQLEENVLTQESLETCIDVESRIACGAVIPLLEKQCFTSPSKKVEESLCEELGNSKDLDFIDIDSDHTNPQMCSLYASDIYANLRAVELIRRPCSNFMEKLQRDITQSMRGILIDWLVEVAEEYKLVPDTLYLTVYIIDRFLSHNYIERQRLQLLGITCMLIASKYEEICAPRVEEFCFITDNTYTRGEVVKMESKVLNYLGFQLSTPTIKTFLRRFIRVAQAAYKVPMLALELLANYVAELTLVECEFLKFIPSLIAASAVFLARWTLDQSNHPWNLTLEHYTSYKASDLKDTVLAMQELQMNTKGCPLNAIREKYRQQKFKSVAALSSPKLLQTLF
ncbi:cyclin-A2-1-like [Magnolia sinica]|uniref:cyclin-A2-1-like n=1 Tax=Magnolia sinica TaxID=86752 RepID=UPI002657B49C|nr:cyclin-A2-1-like [Magnolia sinica]